MTATYTPSFLPQQAVRDLMAPLLVSENDAGRLLSVPRSEVRRLIGEGVLAVVEIGAYRRVVVGSICSYVAKLAEEPQSAKCMPSPMPGDGMAEVLDTERTRQTVASGDRANTKDSDDGRRHPYRKLGTQAR